VRVCHADICELELAQFRFTDKTQYLAALFSQPGKILFSENVGVRDLEFLECQVEIPELILFFFYLPDKIVHINPLIPKKLPRD